MGRKDRILGTAQDLAIDFMVYDRKNDADLPLEEIEKAIKAGEVSEKEIVDAFAKACGFNLG